MLLYVLLNVTKIAFPFVFFESSSETTTKEESKSSSDKRHMAELVDGI
jgi:hypothetical protein